MTFPGKESFRGWGEYLRVASPSMIISCSEWWAWEVTTLVAVLISVEAQAVQTTVTSVYALIYTIPASYQEATAAIIGNCIGANNVPLAERFYILSSLITAISVVFLQFVIFFGRNAIATYYLVSDEAQQTAELIFFLIALTFFFDGMEIFMQGPIRAIELQGRASWITILLFYLIGLPLACSLALKTSLGVVGL